MQLSDQNQKPKKYWLGMRLTQEVLANLLLEWHGGASSGLYAVGSCMLSDARKGIRYNPEKHRGHYDGVFAFNMAVEELKQCRLERKAAGSYAEMKKLANLINCLEAYRPLLSVRIGWERLENPNCRRRDRRIIYRHIASGLRVVWNRHYARWAICSVPVGSVPISPDHVYLLPLSAMNVVDKMFLSKEKKVFDNGQSLDIVPA